MSLVRNSLFITAVCLFCSTAPRPAAAEVFMWQDPGTKLSITYPDDWRQTSGQTADDVFTVNAPGRDDFATCRLRVREDRRFVIYPRKFAGAVQRLNFSKSFWEDYVGEYDDARVNEVHDNGGLGQGFASWADVSYNTAVGPKVQKRGIMFATNYNDHDYILECSAEDSAFSKWYHPFLSMLKSVDMKPEYSTKVNGDYRKFQKDGKLRIYNERPVDMYLYP